MFDEGFADLTMAEIASRLNCSLRTLYTLASSRDELVLIVVDRSLWRVGRQRARARSTPRCHRSTPCAATSGGTRGRDEHDRAVRPRPRRRTGRRSGCAKPTRTTCARSRRACSTPRSTVATSPPIDTSAVARALSRLGADFAKPEVLGEIQTSPKDAADLVVELVLRGLARHERRSDAMTVDLAALAADLKAEQEVLDGIVAGDRRVGLARSHGEPALDGAGSDRAPRVLRRDGVARDHGPGRVQRVARRSAQQQRRSGRGDAQS